MANAVAVVGIGWGDEGKGLITDYLADEKTVVVRYCSGANAGHTVCRNGKRHVFHHFGSGTMRGASTYLSRYFIHNPILFFRELAVLHDLGFDPAVTADADGIVTVPYDMMLNQMVEMARGDQRHGSCGVGINETIKRHEAGYQFTIADLHRPAEALRAIRAEWVPQRMAALGIKATPEWQDRLASDDILEAFVEHCHAYTDHVQRMDIGDVCRGNVVFEGAQGLLLDEDHRFFPHVTHAHTGLRNVVSLMDDSHLDDLTVIYVTRAYATRHGAGPFPREAADLRYDDATNVSNDWQGALRFGHLDFDLMRESVCHDLSHAARPVQLGLAITCLDQVSDMVPFWTQGDLRVATRQDFAHAAHDLIESKVRLASYGPSASHVRQEIFSHLSA